METKISKEDFLAYVRATRHSGTSKKEKRQIFRRIAENIIGNSCKICGESQNLQFHEIHGKNHLVSYWEARYYYYFENSADFVPLCRKCHKIIHNLVKFDITPLRFDRLCKTNPKIAQNRYMVLKLAQILNKNTST